MTMDVETDESVSQQRNSMTMDEEVSIWSTGTPAEAIQLALSQSKLFLVWISSNSDDDPPPSWTSLWTDSTIKSTLIEHAVSIKLDQGTTDASMFLQLVQSPSSAEGVWIVFAGQLLDSFTDPPTPEEMLQRINSTISKSYDLKTASSQPTPPSTSSDPQTLQSDSLRAQLAARRARLEAAKLQHGSPRSSIKLIVDKDEREAHRAAALRQSTSTDPERQKYITQQAKERAQQKSERAKILQQIQADKAERKARAERHPTDASKSPNLPQSTASRMETGGDGTTTVSVRLPDSRILRRDFEMGKTLADVRNWIDESRNDSSAPPYVLQTTFPTRTFEVSEERNETLHSIFGKGGQVIMKEIKTYSEAYSPNTNGVVSLASSIVGSVTGAISNVFGWNTPYTTTTTATETPPRVPGDAIREARIRNVNYSARERGVVGGGSNDGESGDDREKNWFNGNGLAQEAPPRDEGKTD